MITGRSAVVAASVRVVGPLAVVAAAFLFFAGHNRPGGGFAAGLVIGALLALRGLAGVGRPVPAVPLVSLGAIVAGLVALAPVIGGGALLDQGVVSFEVPLLGDVKTGSSLLFDAGVLLIVVGMVAAVLDGLGVVAIATDEAGDGPSSASGGGGGMA
jgi:multicomponent Na+:H+ antiporter subunit A